MLFTPRDRLRPPHHSDMWGNRLAVGASFPRKKPDETISMLAIIGRPFSHHLIKTVSHLFSTVDLGAVIATSIASPVLVHVATSVEYLMFCLLKHHLRYSLPGAHGTNSVPALPKQNQESRCVFSVRSTRVFSQTLSVGPIYRFD